MVKCLLKNLFRNQDWPSAVQFVNTSMHGVSSPFVRRGMSVFGFPDQAVVEVAEQKDPDPEFSTVAFPNPEEKGKPTIPISFRNQFTFGLLQEHLLVTSLSDLITPAHEICQDLALSTADQSHIMYVLAQDPDSDRFAAAEKSYVGNGRVIMPSLTR